MHTNGLSQVDRDTAISPARRMVKVGDVATLRRHWSWIEARLLRLKQKDSVGCEGWQPGHIRQQIISGFAGQSLIELRLILNTDNSLAGFVITSVYADAYTQLPVALVIWIAFGDELMIEQLMPEFEAIARDRFLPEIMFISGRRGWMKKAARSGFHVKRIVYARKVS